MRTEGNRATLAILLSSGALVFGGIASLLRGADQPAPNPQPVFQQYCFQCHGKAAAMAGVNLEQLSAKASVGESYATWQKVIEALEQHRMPPKGMPQPSDEQRSHAVAWIRSELDTFIKRNAGDPGKVTVRRLTSAEYNYAIRDLTGFDLKTGVDATSDSAGGEGFTNYGDVQFMQDA